MIDSAVVLLFFIASLVIGLAASRGMKSLKNFSVGGRSFSAFTIFATLTASYLGGGYMMGNAAKGISKWPNLFFCDARV